MGRKAKVVYREDVHGNRIKSMFLEDGTETLYEEQPPEFGMDAILPRVHYTNEYYFKKERTIWGSESKELFYNYDDRIESKDARDKTNAKMKEFYQNSESGFCWTARWIQTYLEFFHGHKVTLKHVIGGVNKSNFFSYYVYGYICHHDQLLEEAK